MRFGLTTLLASLMAIACLAGTPAIRDEGGFFKPESVKYASNALAEIKKATAKDLTIETFASVPADKTETVAKLDEQGREKFFHKWMAERARSNNVDGVYVLICKNPAHLRVGVDDATMKRGFTEAKRNELRDILLKSFRAKSFDAGLLESVGYVKGVMASLDR